MHQNQSKQARAIAIAKTNEEQIRKLAVIALAITMTAACAYAIMSFAL